MSELIENTDTQGSIRWRLLTGASALALTTYVGSFNLAQAEDADRPTVWIELGGQLSHMPDGQETFAPSIMDMRPSMFEPSQKYEKLPANSFDWQGKISLQPSASDWMLSGAVRYGRARSNRQHLEQTNPNPFSKYHYSYYYGHVTTTRHPLAQKFADTQVRNGESHLVLDFQAGKDVGLGLFGSRSGTSVISAGVRFAQFSSRSNIVLRSDPDWHFNTIYFTPWHIPITYGQPFHNNMANMDADRSFHGIGPSVSWTASVPLVGNSEDRAIMFDWGVNAAVLFGRQKARTHHQTTGQYHSGDGYFNITAPVVLQTTFRGPAMPNHTRSRNVTVPNLGGFAGLSFKYTNAKISLGYRADLFFGAMDGGIDTRKIYDRDFYGPFATLSIGLGG